MSADNALLGTPGTAPAPSDGPTVPVFALWGAPGSGKSGVIGALRGEVEKSVGERWAIDLKAAERAAADVADRAFLALRLRGVKDTAVLRPESPVLFPLRRFEGKRALDAVALDLVDARGRWASVPERDAESQARAIFNRVATSAGIMWLVDVPVAGHGKMDPAFLLPQLVALLEVTGEPHLRIPVALCLSKIDRLSADEMQRALANPTAALRAQLGPAAFGWFEASCPQLRCFALSAAGTVRNAVRPIGLAPIFDWFGEQRRQSVRREQTERQRVRRSASVARVRRVMPRAFAAAAVVALIGAGTVWAATHVRLGGRTWSSSSGTVATPTGTPKPASELPSFPAVSAAPSARPEFVTAADAYQRGDTRSALDALARLQLPTDAPDHASVDSLLALAALKSTEEALAAGAKNTQEAGEVLHLVVNTTSGAIRRGRPGSFSLAPLYLARAVACIGGELGCPEAQIREDLAWVLLLGTPDQQDEARRLRAAWLGDPNALSP